MIFKLILFSILYISILIFLSPIIDHFFDELDTSVNDLFELRTKVSTGQLADVSQVRKARRKIALLRTLINEIEE